MKYKEMLEYIYNERKKIDDSVNAIIRINGGETMRPDMPAANSEQLKKQKGLFSSARV